MRRVIFVPGAVASPGAITIPVSEPDIDAVVSARIDRIPSALADHAVHLHDMLLEVVADAAGDRVNSALGPPVTFGRPAAGALVVAVQATRGVQNNAAAQAHGGANPVVAAVPTRLTARTISLNVNTLVGDLLELNYLERGERVPVS